jgi:hypothetical protein
VQLKPLVPGVEIRGLAIQLTLTGFKILPSITRGYLKKHGILTGGATDLDPEGWYLQSAWLKVFEDVYKEIGPSSTFEMGRHIGQGYPVPPDITDVPAMLKFLDVGYHLAHRRDGRVMFDPLTGKMSEGIGHYASRPGGKDEFLLVCDNPYPCEFDHGLATSCVQRFKARARVTHGPGGCRKTGAASCTYVSTW